MSRIEILVDIPEEEGYESFVIDSIVERCKLDGCNVKSISISGNTNITKEFIEQEDIIEAEFEVIT